MSDIDPEKLEEAIQYCEGAASGYGRIVLAAARAHLATLPRFKEVEMVRWAVVTEDGDWHGVYLREEDAKFRVAQSDKLSIVRLTGTAKVKVTP